MHIVCPHCTTSYAINPATLGPGGRTVRCSRCKETWQARPEDAMEMAAAMPAAMPGSGQSAPSAPNDAAAEWEALAREEEGQDAPVVDSPSISAGWLDRAEAGMASGTAAAISTASWGRACQVSLQREQRTVRPSAPRVAGLMA